MTRLLSFIEILLSDRGGLQEVPILFQSWTGDPSVCRYYEGVLKIKHPDFISKDPEKFAWPTYDYDFFPRLRGGRNGGWYVEIHDKELPYR